MGNYYLTKKEQERVVLIGVVINNNSIDWKDDNLSELRLLTKTTGVKVVESFTQNLLKPNSTTFIGKGKLEEIAIFIKNNKIDIAVFDNDLSASQLRNIEKLINIRVLDRTHLILDIFASRAKTAHAKVQVELAQYQYLLPRLTRMWTHLERQQGGVGVRGPGEKEIETDRRNIRKKITKLKKELNKIDKQKITQRKSRGNFTRIALVGYTNTGKSTILNLLSNSNILAQNKLFATLDTTVRKIIIKNKTFLLSDTVGFIHKLPHTLIESFKATLDEVREADILLHIADISNKDVEHQINVVNKTLEEIGAGDKKAILVFNKIDTNIKHSNNPATHNSNIYNKDVTNNKIFISAKEKINIEQLKNIIYNNCM
jgi:GTP-binding protein HflX